MHVLHTAASFCSLGKQNLSNVASVLLGSMTERMLSDLFKQSDSEELTFNLGMITLTFVSRMWENELILRTLFKLLHFKIGACGERCQIFSGQKSC